MCSIDKYHAQPTSAGKNEREGERELIMAILEKINHFRIAKYKQDEESDQLIKNMVVELEYTESGRADLTVELGKGFESVKSLFRRRSLGAAATAFDPILMRIDLRDLCKKDEMEHKEHWLTNKELLTNISDELQRLKNTRLVQVLISLEEWNI